MEPASTPSGTHLGGLELPRDARHDIHCVCAAHTDRAHAEAPAVGRVAVRADHQPARERVVLQDDLVNNAGARLPVGVNGAREGRVRDMGVEQQRWWIATHSPETHAELGGGTREEVCTHTTKAFTNETRVISITKQQHHAVRRTVDFFVRRVGGGKVRSRPLLSRNQVIAVHRRGRQYLRKTRRYELENGHLRRCILHGDAVRAELQVCLATNGDLKQRCSC